MNACLARNGDRFGLAPKLAVLAHEWMKDGGSSVEFSEVLVELGLARRQGARLVTTGTGLALAQFVESLRAVPAYDSRTGRLSWRGTVVKELKRKAPNQRAILEAFEASGWRGPVDDPLGDGGGAEAAERLRETVKSLNEGVPGGTIRFHADGRGGAVRWSEG